MASDIEQLTALNGTYIHSDQFRDVERYQEILADDYRATLPDLVFRNKMQFLQMLSDAPRPFTDLKPMMSRSACSATSHSSTPA